MKKLRLFVLFALLGCSLVAKAIAPIFIAQGVELILASEAVVTLPTATAAGVSAAWTGVVTGLGAAVAYFALKDAGGTNAVAVPVGSTPIVAPSAAGTASTVLEYYSTIGGAPMGTGSSAAAACAAAVSNASIYYPANGSPGRTYEMTGSTNTQCQWNYLDDGLVSGSSVSVIFNAPNCPAGYTVSGPSCILNNAYLAVDDHRCDVARSSGVWVYVAADSTNCGSGSPMRGAINGDTITVQGKDSFGNPVINSIQATTDGGTVLHQQVQVVDANGNTAIVDKTARFDSSGNYVGQTQALLSGSLAVDPVTGTITPQAAPAGSATPSSSLSNVQFPNDYNREVTQQAVLTKLGEIKDKMVETSTVPVDPVSRTGSEISSAFFPSTFTAIQSWTLPVHAAACPVITFDAFGSSYTVNSHCALIDANAPLLANAFLIMWTLAAMFIVLRA